MFAILITPDNEEKILERHQTSTPSDGPHLNLDVYLESARTWYYVDGWHNKRERTVSWTILPEYVLVGKYEFDPHKIKTDWDQIVLN